MTGSEYAQGGPDDCGRHRLRRSLADRGLVVVTADEGRLPIVRTPLVPTIRYIRENLSLRIRCFDPGIGIRHALRDRPILQHKTRHHCLQAEESDRHQQKERNGQFDERPSAFAMGTPSRSWNAVLHAA